ncbi:AAA family ATPase [Maribacter aquivivus]|uniref:AAA family ATPase n=1 Tax=Maribacter aquivivus TaxID=228958 RepID=UPI002493A044|nr:AAA family ATPase [Maribacter aquivivus]
MLKNLYDLKNKVSQQIHDNLESIVELTLTDEIIEGLLSLDLPLQIEGSTGKFITKKSMLVYIPAAWFYSAAKLQALLNELNKYKEIVDSIYNDSGLIEISYKDWTEEVKGDSLNENIVEYINDKYPIEKEFIIKFLEDYNWWGGGKFIGRGQGDFAHSAMLSASGFLNETSGFISNLAYAMNGHDTLINNIVTLVENSNNFNETKILISESTTASLVFSSFKYLIESNRDYFVSLINEVNSKLINGEEVKECEIGGLLKNVLIKSDKELTSEKLITSGVVLYFEESILTLNDEYYYLNTIWDNNEQSSLQFKYFVNFIAEYFPSYIAYEINGDYIFKVIEYAHNRILYGAPGTGKSYILEKQSRNTKTIRTTFHPDMSYGQFVGTYKPVSNENGDISYELVVGPFLKAIELAHERDKNNNHNQVILIIEELNRSNVSAVFGDIFQLLDRGNDGKSEYSIQLNSDIHKHLKSIGINLSNGFTIPSNMSIWATMNSADQGVFPLDAAFKRRWSMEYVGIDQSESAILSQKMVFNNAASVPWNDFRKALNEYLVELSIDEDKLIGPFFLTGKELSNSNGFKGKLALYLWDDVLRHKNRKRLFTTKSLSEMMSIIKEEKNIITLLTKIFSSSFIDFISNKEFITILGNEE